ncbi:MAG: hypothetical protein HRT89_23335, partial [Lentisphaeria bacterium]|nr:hypothetical protein [Lentisphaeria bacterium]
YYQQFDADPNLEFPQENFGGWNTGEVELDPKHTAIVVMHAWDLGTPEEHPGLFRAVGCTQATYDICENVFPDFLSAVRKSDFHLFHIVSGSGYFEDYDGYKRTLALDNPEVELAQADPDSTYNELRAFKGKNVFTGEHNGEDMRGAWARVAFPKEAEPQGDEGIAKDEHQLTALCQDAGVNHIIYAGFNIDWCLIMSPAGMVDMNRRGFICSAFRDAVTAVENKETVREGISKDVSLWRVSVGFGFVFETVDFIKAID